LTTCPTRVFQYALPSPPFFLLPYFFFFVIFSVVFDGTELQESQVILREPSCKSLELGTLTFSLIAFLLPLPLSLESLSPCFPYPWSGFPDGHLVIRIPDQENLRHAAELAWTVIIDSPFSPPFLFSFSLTPFSPCLCTAALTNDDAVGPHAQAVVARARLIEYRLPCRFGGRLRN